MQKTKTKQKKLDPLKTKDKIIFELKNTKTK